MTGAPDGEIVEYLTMRAAALTGIPTARVQLLQFDGEHTLVVERFDRTAGGRTFAGRLHQEDLMQALGRPRLVKYERDGGPSLDDIGGFELGTIARRCGLASSDLVAQTAGRCLALPGIIEDLAAELPSPLQTAVVARFVEWMPIRAEQAFEALVPRF